MPNNLKFYIDGAWENPAVPRTLEVINPASEEAFATIALGSAADVDRAVDAARAAFETFSLTSKDDRIALLKRVIEVYKARIEDIAQAISKEMGAPIAMARSSQAMAGLAQLRSTLKGLERYEFEEQRGAMRIAYEGIGVAGLITPWNWPLNQIACKVGPALAAGCTMVLKPSEIAPISAIVFSEVMDAAGVPAGVYNMVNGDGPTVGDAMSRHPGIDMMSFTGSTRAGVLVAKAAADTVKRVTQELGGKSPNIILDDVDLATAVTKGAQTCFGNSGQSCNAPTRMLVPRKMHDEAMEIAKAAAESLVVGDPAAEATTLGPVVSDIQFDKIQKLIESGIREGATLATGGLGRPDGSNRGYFVRPTVFGHVTPEMTIAREEIFGPVLSIMPYDSEEEAVAIANDTVYGLAAYIASGDIERARKLARRVRAGQVRLNFAPSDASAPFGGYKQSGNGRECGEWGIHDFLEVKAMMGYGAD